MGGLGSLPLGTFGGCPGPLDGRRARYRPRHLLPRHLRPHHVVDRRGVRSPLSRSLWERSCRHHLGHGRWRVDWLLSRVTEFVLSFPQTADAHRPVDDRDRPASRTALHVERTPASMVFMILVMGFFGWPNFARIIRGQVLSLEEREFVEAARSPGRGPLADLLQGAPSPPVGADPGLLDADHAAEHRHRSRPRLPRRGDPGTRPRRSARSSTTRCTTRTADPAYFIFPGVTLFLVVLSFNLVGDGFRDALDPKADRQ